MAHSRFGYILRAVVLVLGLVLATGPSLAADVFRVTDIPVDVTAESAVAARAQAIADAQRAGLRRLMERLTAPSEHGSLPAPGDIDRYVESFEIASENVGPTRYIARLNVTYAPGQVEDLLRDSGVTYVDRRGEPTLLVPVLRTEAGFDAWSDTNPWRAAWSDAGELPTFLELRLPLGDLADVTAADAGSVAAADPAAIDALAARYGTERTLVALAALPPPAGPDDPARVEVELRDAGEEGAPVARETFTAGPAEPVPELLGRAVSWTVLEAENAWKSRNLVPLDRLAALQAAVPLVDLAGWIQIKSRLAGVTGLRSVEVDALSQRRATVTLHYAGEIAQLEEAVGRAGLSLTQGSDGWLLRQAGDLGVSPSPLVGSPPGP